MITRTVASLSAGIPVMHPIGTEVFTLIEKYSAGWLYEDEHEVYGILDWIDSHPQNLRRKE